MDDVLIHSSIFDHLWGYSIAMFTGCVSSQIWDSTGSISMGGSRYLRPCDLPGSSRISQDAISGSSSHSFHIIISVKCMLKEN